MMDSYVVKIQKLQHRLLPMCKKRDNLPIDLMIWVKKSKIYP